MTYNMFGVNYLHLERVSGAGRKSGGAGVSENDGAGAKAEREVPERERNVELAESVAHSPLQPNISLTS